MKITPVNNNNHRKKHEWTPLLFPSFKYYEERLWWTPCQSTWLSFPDHQSWYVHKIYTRLLAKRKAALFIRVFNSPTTLLSLIPLCLSLSLSDRCKGESQQFYITNYLPTASSFVFLFSKQIWSMLTKIIFHKTRKKQTKTPSMLLYIWLFLCCFN